MSRKICFVAVLALVAACNTQNVDDENVPEDFATGADLSAAAHDLTLAPPVDFSAPANVDLAMSLVSDLATQKDLWHAADLANAPISCLPSGGCGAGPPCGAGCCAAGEACDPDSNTCRCGLNPACAVQMICASGAFHTNGCGDICCGNGVPCPP